MKRGKEGGRKGGREGGREVGREEGRRKGGIAVELLELMHHRLSIDKLYYIHYRW